MSEIEEWITSAEALELLKPISLSISMRTICKRAHAGLVRAKSERFISGLNVKDDHEIPKEFWWAEGEAALVQNWHTGDFDTWLEKQLHLQAYGVAFWRADIERLRPKINAKTERKEKLMETASKKVFIGHGRSLLWRPLQNFLQSRLGLIVDEFNVEPTAGITTKERLEEMLNEATFAFLVMTAEDEQPDGTKRARENVIHEVGLFQGRLGFRKAIVMLERGCNEFSNIAGVGEIRFGKGDIESKFEEVRRTLERESIIETSNW